VTIPKEEHWLKKCQFYFFSTKAKGPPLLVEISNRSTGKKMRNAGQLKSGVTSNRYWEI
jgi:hypothetical protein